MMASDSDMKSRRKQAAHRRRRLIFNNDNEERRKLRRVPGPITPQVFLEADTIGIAGSHVDTISYCDGHGFGLFTHRSDVTEVYVDPNGVSKALHELGTDPLQVMVDFCRASGLEIFWSFRMNDPHDSWRPEQLPHFKKDHPEFLFGTKEDPPPRGAWSGVDYARPAVRDWGLQAIRDTFEHYDVDGVEFDFFRVPTCFKKLAWGEPIGQAERDLMTDFLAQARRIIDGVAAKRDKPLLIAVRVPDSTAYCEALGLDLTRWLADDLIDLMIVGGYFWLEPWSVSVELGHRHGVPVYPSLDGSRVGAPIGRTRLGMEISHTRRSREAYRAHALNVWRAGVDGVYLFNLHFRHNPTDAFWHELGDAQVLAPLDKLYHVSVMGKGWDPLDYYLPHGNEFMRLPTLCPDHPVKLAPGATHNTSMTVGDNFSATSSSGPVLKLNVRVEDLHEVGQLVVMLNGERLAYCVPTLAGEIYEQWHECPVDARQVRQGDNEIALSLDQAAAGACIVHDVQLSVKYA